MHLRIIVVSRWVGFSTLDGQGWGDVRVYCYASGDAPLQCHYVVCC